MRRLSIRLRLALVVAGTLAVVLFGVGVYVFERVSASLDQPIASELREHVSGLQRGVQEGEPFTGRGPAGTQVLDTRGHLLNHAVESPARALLTAAQVRATLARGSFGPVTAGGLRIRAAIGKWRAQPVVVVASASLAQRDNALDRLATELLLGGLAGLLAAAFAAYAIATRAFRPFEAMRRQAAAISAAEPGGRLEVPRSDDELARLAETLNDMLDRLERALAHERRFVAEASHELRTPLAVLRAELELARSRPRSPQELAEALDSVAEETDRLTRLADDLLLLARADDGGIQRRTAIDVRELLEMVATRFEPRAHERRRPLTVSAPEGVHLDGDRSALHRALTNLVDNALRYGAGAVRLEARERGDQVELHVVDEGDGFPEDFLPVAFERFSRANGERSPDGAGLGLALVRAVAVAHGGTAEVGDGPHGGADVWLALPRKGAPQTAERMRTTSSAR